jgi:putative aldouronate transport system substrate-binding protein
VWLNEMNGTPYLWKQEGGKFTSQYETDGYRKSLDTIAKMLKEGLFFPDAFGTNLIQDLIGSGKVFMNNGGAGTAYFQYPDLYKQAAPTFALGYLEPMKWDGGGRSPIYLGTAKYAGPVAIRKASKDRVAYILSVMDYLASPFGTAEYLFNNFGVEGTDFTFTKTNPIKTPAGVKETNLPLRYMAAGPLVTYYGKDPQAGRDYHGYQTSVLDSTVDAASLGLYSPTEQSKASLTTDLTAIQDDVMQGRKSLKDWDNAVAKWRKNGGDQIRKEYEQAFEKSH